ncbi:hypothetical protein C2L74_28605 [Bacillus anthracis]|nr:hypothetical protein C2L74_28605 [Bacillus anthracis]
MAVAEYFAAVKTTLTRTQKATNLNMTGIPVSNTFVTAFFSYKKSRLALSPPKTRTGIVSINP